MLPSRQTTTTLEESRTTIGAVLRSLRRSRRMTQAALAERLGLSQGRLSEVESGSASLSAEQFLEVLRFFNVGLSTFDPTARRDREAELQRLVARYGGDHLMEREGLLVESPRAGLYELIPEVLALGRARLVSALAPVVVRHIDEINLSAIAVSMAITGLWRRLAWLVENIHEALRLELAGGGLDPADDQIDEVGLLACRRDQMIGTGQVGPVDSRGKHCSNRNVGRPSTRAARADLPERFERRC